MMAVITATYSEFVYTELSSDSVNRAVMCERVNEVSNGHSFTNGMTRITANSESTHASVSTEPMPHSQSRTGPLGSSTCETLE